MDENEQKQQLSIAYLHAVASAVGFACQAPGTSITTAWITLSLAAVGFTKRRCSAPRKSTCS